MMWVMLCLLSSRSVCQTFPVCSLLTVAAGPVSGVHLQPRTLPVGPSRSTQPAANHLKPTETKKKSPPQIQHRSSFRLVKFLTFLCTGKANSFTCDLNL